MTAGTEARGRIGALDGLRGLAIIGVIGFHADVLFGGDYGPAGSTLLSRVLGAGWLGVQLFFVLSGFLITSILLERKRSCRRGAYFGGFYLRRACRILPLYYGFLVLYFLVLRHLPGGDLSTHLSAADRASLFLFYYNNRVAFGGPGIPVLHMYWSLCIEEQFYLVWPFVVWFLSGRMLGWVCGALAVAALAVRVWAVQQPHGMSLAYLATPCALDGLAIGSLVALLKANPRTWPRTTRTAGAVAAACAAAALGLAISQGHFFANVDAREGRIPFPHDSGLIETWGITLATVGFGAVVVFVFETDSAVAASLRRVLEWGALRRIGFYSYAMYVFHRVILRTLDFLGYQYVPGYAHLPPAVAKPVAIAVVAAVAYAAARLSYVVWERPFLRLRNRRA